MFIRMLQFLAQAIPFILLCLAARKANLNKIDRGRQVLMPFIALLSAIFIGWVMKPDWIAEEMERGGKHFGRKRLYVVMIKYILPVIMLILFLQSTGILNNF